MHWHYRPCRLELRIHFVIVTEIKEGDLERIYWLSCVSWISYLHLQNPFFKCYTSPASPSPQTPSPRTRGSASHLLYLTHNNAWSWFVPLLTRGLVRAEHQVSKSLINVLIREETFKPLPPDVVVRLQVPQWNTNLHLANALLSIIFAALLPVFSARRVAIVSLT